MRWVVISLLFVSGCTKGTSTRDRVEQYCKKCGGLKQFAANDNTAMIECVDGTGFTVKNVTELILGECK